MIQRVLQLVFPAKCVLCEQVLKRCESDFCSNCRKTITPLPPPKLKLKYIKKWTALWHYDPPIRESIIRFKFNNHPTYGTTYGRYLAAKLSCEEIDFDIVTSVPLSKKRKWKRGYDQTRIIAESISEVSGKPYIVTLRKIRHTKPQSLLSGAAERKANILGSYAAKDSERFAGKRILIVDDVVTTGATVSECARVLLTAGAKNISCAAVASAMKKTM